MYVIGTAGHVDHGKSTLVQALTGIDPDRLEEEKARGMTIDLGFAWLQLPGGLEVSIVDVPGHERFIKNMLAGVGGIDLALLVVAADEGVMPQTREHLAIVDLLGIRGGVVAITKRDLVDQDWLDLVTADVEDHLKGTSLEGAALVACSATTGAGLDVLKASIEARLATTPPKRDLGRPRLAIDRAFTISGFGTVVTGTLVDGSLRVGQEIEIVPRGIKSRIRGLQMHRTKAEVARPGSRVAVNLTGVATDDVRRGDVVTLPGWHAVAGAVDVQLDAVRDLPRPLRHNTPVSFHTGAAEVPALVRLLDRDELAPGESAWAQIRLDAPLAAIRGDRFVIRSPSETLGGGRIIDTRARRHRRNHAPTLNRLAALAEGSPEDTLLALIERVQPVTVAALAKQTELDDAGLTAVLDTLAGQGRVILLGDAALPQRLAFTAPEVERLADTAEAALAAYFESHPLRQGMSREELRSRLRLPAREFNALLARWLEAGRLADARGTIAPPNHTVALSAVQAAQAKRFLAELAAAPFAPQPTTVPDPDLLAYLTEAGEIVPVGEGVVFAHDAYRTMVDRITDHLRANGTVTLAQVRDLFGASRKYAQALLEHMDEQRITRRVGDERVLR